MADGAAAATSKGAPDPLIGRVINDRYKVLALIARGGMGKVYRAEQSPLGRICALKVLNPNYSGTQDPEFHKRFFLEASMTAKLRHPNTVMVFDYGRTEDNVYYMAMEYLEGHTLHRAIRQAGHFSEERTAHIARQICRSLREAHTLGVIHRDLKPANVYLLEHGDEPDFVKVLDFGLVKNVADNHGEELTQAGLFMGSPKYMAPEQVTGGDVDARTDIYALGVIMYEMVTGKVPFDRASNISMLMAQVNEEAPSIRKTNPAAKVSASMEEAIMRSMAKAQQDRFRSMDEVLAALKRLGPSPAAEPSTSLVEALPSTATTGSGPVSRVIEAKGAAIAAPPAVPASASSAAIATFAQSPPGQSLRATKPVVIGGVIAGLVLAGAIGYLSLHKSVSRTAQTPAAAENAATPTAPASNAPPVAPAPTGPADGKPVVEVDFSSLAPASANAAKPAPPAAPPPGPAAARPRPAAGPPPAPAAAPKPPAAAGAATPKAGANCNPPFAYDADGNKHFKPECFSQ